MPEAAVGSNGQLRTVFVSLGHAVPVAADRLCTPSSGRSASACARWPAGRARSSPPRRRAGRRRVRYPLADCGGRVEGPRPKPPRLIASSGQPAAHRRRGDHATRPSATARAANSEELRRVIAFASATSAANTRGRPDRFGRPAHPIVARRTADATGSRHRSAHRAARRSHYWTVRPQPTAQSWPGSPAHRALCNSGTDALGVGQRHNEPRRSRHRKLTIITKARHFHGHCQVNWWAYRLRVVRRFWWKTLSQFTFRRRSWSPR